MQMGYKMPVNPMLNAMNFQNQMVPMMGQMLYNMGANPLAANPMFYDDMNMDDITGMDYEQYMALMGQQAIAQKMFDPTTGTMTTGNSGTSSNTGGASANADATSAGPSFRRKL